MRIVTVIIWVMATLSIFFGCDNDPNPVDSESSGYAIDTAIVDYKDVNNVVYYDFSDGDKKVVEHDSWHLAFDENRSLVANSGEYGYGALVCSTGIHDISEDLSSWVDSVDEEDETGHFRLINEDSNVLGLNYKEGSGMSSEYTGLVYILKTETNSFYKFSVTGSLPMGAGLRMKIDSLGGTGGVEDTFFMQDDYSYTYIDLKTKSRVDVAPPAGEWDIKFGRTGDYIMSSLTSGRSSIAINKNAGVEAAVDTGVQLDDVKDALDYTFSSDLLSIGHDWYEHEYGENGHVYYTLENVYVVKTTEGNYAKMKLLTFKGPDSESFWAQFKYHYQDDGSSDFIK
ncbi:MAG: HmuY family protein [Chitinivibrionales bacterium]